MQPISLEAYTPGRVSALWAGGVTPGDVLCQGMAFPQGTGCERLQPGKGTSSLFRTKQRSL